MGDNMTIEKAIQLLEALQFDSYGSASSAFLYNGIKKDSEEAIKMAVDALKKIESLTRDVKQEANRDIGGNDPRWIIGYKNAMNEVIEMIKE